MNVSSNYLIKSLVRGFKNISRLILRLKTNNVSSAPRPFLNLILRLIHIYDGTTHELETQDLGFYLNQVFIKRLVDFVYGTASYPDCLTRELTVRREQPLIFKHNIDKFLLAV